MLLPWEYGVRNLLRRPTRSLLTLLALTLVVLLVLVVVGFVRGLEKSLAVSGDPRVVYVHSLGSSEHLENSSVEASTADQVSFSLSAIRRRAGADGNPILYASPELYLGTQVSVDAGEPGLGLVRGVTERVPYVRSRVQVLEGAWPTRPFEVLVGRLAATKLGLSAEDLGVGKTVTFEGQAWRVSGRFAAGGSGHEAEIWCRLDDLQYVLKRQDLSYVALMLAPDARVGDVAEFCKSRIKLEIEATPETDYYKMLSKHYAPVRTMSWLIVVLLAGAGVFAGLNAMYGAVVGRARELATLQTLGFRRRAIALAIVQESLLLAALACLVASLVALALLHGLAIRFTMGAFTLEIDSVTLLWGFGVGLGLGVVGALPPAFRAMALPIAEGLKAA